MLQMLVFTLREGIEAFLIVAINSSCVLLPTRQAHPLTHLARP